MKGPAPAAPPSRAHLTRPDEQLRLLLRRRLCCRLLEVSHQGRGVGRQALDRLRQQAPAQRWVLKASLAQVVPGVDQRHWREGWEGEIVQAFQVRAIWGPGGQARPHLAARGRMA